MFIFSFLYIYNNKNIFLFFSLHFPLPDLYIEYNWILNQTLDCQWIEIGIAWGVFSCCI